MTIRSSEDAIAYAEALQHAGHDIGRGNCLKRVREAFGVDAIGDYDGDGQADAEDGWKATKLRHRIDAVADVPRGVPVWWLGGSVDNGHVAISVGNGWCMSPGTPDDPNHWGMVRIATIAQRWGGLTLTGWSEDLLGLTIWTKPAPPPPPPAPVDVLVLRPGSIAHVAKGVPYFLLNSLRGLHTARRARKARADRDLQLTKDGVIVVTHWPRPLLTHGPRGHDVFVDPLRKLGRTRTIRSMTWQEVKRLRTKRGSYRINMLARDLEEAGRLGIGVVLEPKTPDPRWQDVDLWRAVREQARLAGVPWVTGYVLKANSAAAPAMRAAGIPTQILGR